MSKKEKNKKKSKDDHPKDSPKKSSGSKLSRKDYEKKLEELQMSNENLMLTKNVKMHTRPILDIHTKEIECSHGCTISNINKDHLYYLQSRGFSKEKAKDILVDSFLC